MTQVWHTVNDVQLVHRVGHAVQTVVEVGKLPTLQVTQVIVAPEILQVAHRGIEVVQRMQTFVTVSKSA